MQKWARSVSYAGVLCIIACMAVLASMPSGHGPLFAESRQSDAVLDRWKLIDTSVGVIRWNARSGGASLLSVADGTHSWVEILEPPRVDIQREKRMRNLFHRGLSEPSRDDGKIHLKVRDDTLEEFGLFKGDFIVGVSGKLLSREGHLANMISEAWHSDAARVQLRVLRDGAEFDLILRARE